MSEWVKFHAELTKGAKRGLKREHRFVYLELSLLARPLAGVVELPVGMGDVSGTLDLLGGEAAQVKAALPKLIAADMIRFEGPDGARRLVVVSWLRWNDAPGSSTERVRRFRERAATEPKRVSGNESDRSETPVERFGNASRGEEIEKREEDPETPIAPTAPAPPEPEVAPPPAARVSKPSRPKPEAHPRHADVVAAYFEAFQAAKGEKPPFDGADGTAVVRLLAKLGGDADRAIAVIRSAYADRFKASSATIRSISADPGRYLGGRAGAPTNGRPVQPHAPTGRSRSLDDWYRDHPPTDDPI